MIQDGRTDRGRKVGMSMSVEELARELPEIDWEAPARTQPAIGYVQRRRFGL